jgi:hypothetical protein
MKAMKDSELALVGGAYIPMPGTTEPLPWEKPDTSPFPWPFPHGERYPVTQPTVVPLGP